MITKPKTVVRRKQSHSRERPSNLRSHSKSTEKNKQRSDSKLLLRLKQQDHAQNSEDNQRVNPSYQVLNRINLKKTASGKHIDSDSEYYSHFRAKSKSKGKLHPEQDPQKLKYINSIYMHKESANAISVSNLDQSAKAMQLQKAGRNGEREEAGTHTNLVLMNKIKIIERNCGIDANGKFVAKETVKAQHGEGSRNMDSLNTISAFETDKKKEKGKRREKTRRDVLKGARSKKAEEKGGEGAKIISVKSADKLGRKKQVRDINSPSVLDQKEVEFLSNLPQLKPNAFAKNAKPILPTSVTSSNGKTMLLEQTRTSPNQEAEQPDRPVHNISVEAVIREIEDESRSSLNVQKLKLLYGSELWLERIRCISFIGRLCSNLSIRREAHSLAIFYMDKYVMILEKEVTPKQLKLIAMTALLLGLKMDDGIMSRKLCHEYIKNMEAILGSDSRVDSKSRSIQKQKEIISAFSSKQNSGSMAKSKSQSSISDVGMSRGDDPKRSRKQQVVHSKQMSIILALQLDMMLKFSFKLMARSTTYWVDALTVLWDGYIVEEIAWDDEMLFRSEKNKRNISHCYQIVEKMQQEIEVYQYSKPLLVLSTMYLIIRMRMEQQKEGQSERRIYAKYTESLGKSTNLIFYDGVGVNELFGDFLEDLDMNISTLIEAIRFVGRHLGEEFKVFGFSGKGKYVNCRTYEQSLSIYESNYGLYKLSEEG